MGFFEVVNSRSSVREYKDDPVPLETVRKIIEAARVAPSWANSQCWRFVIVDSHVEKNIIGNTTGQANIAKACKDAPYVIVLCANPKESGSKNGMDYYMFDCGLAMQNLSLAARSEGLDTCIVGWFDEKAIKGVLNVPNNFKVVAFTPLGYAKETPVRKARRKYSENVFHNFWGKAYE